MDTVREEITEMEERLRVAELGPDPQFFEDVLADDAVLVLQEGTSFTKSKVVEVHQPGKGPKFINVEMSAMEIVDHGTAAVVTCNGLYETGTSPPMFLKFMRVWVKRDGHWKIVAASTANVG